MTFLPFPILHVLLLESKNEQSYQSRICLRQAMTTRSFGFERSSGQEEIDGAVARSARSPVVFLPPFPSPPQIVLRKEIFEEQPTPSKRRTFPRPFPPSDPPLSSLSSLVCQTSTPSDLPVSARPSPFVQHPPPFTLLPNPRCSSLPPPTSLPRSPSPRSALLRVRRPLCCFRSLAQQTDVLSLLPISLPSLSSCLLPVLLFLLLLFSLAVLPLASSPSGPWTRQATGDGRRSRLRARRHRIPPAGCYVRGRCRCYWPRRPAGHRRV